MIIKLLKSYESLKLKLKKTNTKENILLNPNFTYLLIQYCTDENQWVKVEDLSMSRRVANLEDFYILYFYFQLFCELILCICIYTL